MKDPRIDRLAEVYVGYSTEIKPGDRVLIEAEVDSVWVRLSIPVKGYVAREYLNPASPPES